MRWLAGLLLVSAAILKATEFAIEPREHLTLPIGRFFLPIQFGIEWGLGLIVLSGFYWSHVRRFAIVLFAALAAYSFVLALSGATSCGCFGSIKVNPWWTFSLDLIVVIGLLFSTQVDGGNACHAPTLRSQLIRPQCAIATIVVTSALAAVLISWYVTSESSPLTRPGAGPIMFLEPEAWVGQPFPIAGEIDLDVSKDEWVLLLHRHDCNDCERVIPKYADLAERNPDIRIALVEIPPFGSLNAKVNDSCLRARLEASHDWFVQTPVEIQLKDGIVQRASRELPAIAGR